MQCNSSPSGRTNRRHKAKAPPARRHARLHLPLLPISPAGDWCLPPQPSSGGDGGGLRRLLPRRGSGPRRPDQRPGGRRLLQGLRPAPARPRAGGPQISSLSSPAPRRSYHGDLCSPATPVRFESQGAWSVRPSCSVGISSSLGLREPRFWIPRCSFWFMDGCRCIPLLPKESTLSYFSVVMLKCVLLLLP